MDGRTHESDLPRTPMPAHVGETMGRRPPPALFRPSLVAACEKAKMRCGRKVTPRSTLRSHPKHPAPAPGMLGRMKTLPRTHRVLLASVIRAGLSIPMIWLGRAISRRRLRALDARGLADVGLSESGRRRECARWCWQGRRLADRP